MRAHSNDCAHLKCARERAIRGHSSTARRNWPGFEAANACTNMRRLSVVSERSGVRGVSTAAAAYRRIFSHTHTPSPTTIVGRSRHTQADEFSQDLLRIMRARAQIYGQRSAELGHRLRHDDGAHRIAPLYISSLCACAERTCVSVLSHTNARSCVCECVFARRRPA